jgi:hypothetical protein
LVRSDRSSPNGVTATLTPPVEAAAGSAAGFKASVRGTVSPGPAQAASIVTKLSTSTSRVTSFTMTTSVGMAEQRPDMDEMMVIDGAET